MRLSASAVLTIVLAATAIPGHSRAATAQGSPPCSIDPIQVPHSPVETDGTVVGPVSPEKAKIATERVEKKTGIGISPDYADLPRVVVRITRGKDVSETLATVVDGHIPRPGDHVKLLSRYRDPRSRCNFIQWTVGSVPAIS